VKFGMITHPSSLYTAISGEGSAVAARMAGHDYGGKVLGMPIEYVVPDRQNKFDIASSIAHRWVDVDGVTAFANIATSSTALAVQTLEREQQRAVVPIAGAGAGARPLADQQCSPVGVLWAWNTYSAATGSANTVAEQGGSKNWLFVTAECAFGHALGKDAADVGDRTVIGSPHHPPNTPDFSSLLLQALNSSADVVALANAGGDMSNVKQAYEFGITKFGKRLAALLTFITDVQSVGLDQAQGLLLTTTFYWNRNAETRAWTERISKVHGAMPAMVQACTYLRGAHYLEAVQAGGTVQARCGRKKATRVAGQRHVRGERLDPRERAHDARHVPDQVKKPAEPKQPWNDYSVLARIWAEKASWPLSESNCPAVQEARRAARREDKRPKWH